MRRAVALLAALLATACGGATAGEPAAVVFAAASLTEPFEALATAFERARPGAQVELHFAGTPQLVLQLREGAAADVFASADPENMRRVVELGRAAGPPRVVARNRLRIAVAPGNPRGVRGLADLARGDLLVALCAPDVPAGRYARRALASAGAQVASVSDEPSVKALVAKVSLGELDAGVVYATDVRAAAGAVEGVAVAAEHDVVAEYPLVVLRGGRSPGGGEAFAAFALSPEGARVLREHGFEVP